jgi:DNA-binding transcriptional ArsR family regulator
MRPEEIARAVARARAIGDQTRVRILLRLLEKPHPVGRIARELHVAPSAISRHLQVLFNAGLVDRRRAASEVIYMIPRKGLGRCLRLLASAPRSL